MTRKNRFTRVCLWIKDLGPWLPDPSDCNAKAGSATLIVHNPNTARYWSVCYGTPAVYRSVCHICMTAL